MLISSYGHSDVGFVRENNEDSFLANDEKKIYAVADGVGGLPFGNLASRLAVQFYDSLVHGINDCLDIKTLVRYSNCIHKYIIECGNLVSEENGIGTTFSAVRITEHNFLFVHVGDSSIFVHDSNGLRKISKTHTLRDELIGKHGQDAALDMPEHYGHTLTRCMGQDIDFEVDLGELTLKPGMKILICSDGITNMVEESEIEKIVSNNDSREVVTELIDQSNQNGGVDNSTCVCVRVM